MKTPQLARRRVTDKVTPDHLIALVHRDEPYLITFLEEEWNAWHCDTLRTVRHLGSFRHVGDAMTAILSHGA